MFNQYRRSRSAIGTLLRYVKSLGFLHGPRLYVRVHLRNGETSLKVPGYSAELIVRRGTSDVEVFEDVIIRRVYDFGCEGRKPSVIVDGGANAGYSSLFFACKFPEARILAVEPSESNYRILVKNISAYPKIEPVNAALWPTEATLVIENPQDEPWEFRMKQADDGTIDGVSSISMNDVLQRVNAPVDLLKLDIEGAEKQLFDSPDLTWMDQVHSIAIELHDRLVPGCSKTFNRAIDSCDYRQELSGEHVHIIRLDHENSAHTVT
jgi:FkbM family methyltransferase